MESLDDIPIVRGIIRWLKGDRPGSHAPDRPSDSAQQSHRRFSRRPPVPGGRDRPPAATDRRLEDIARAGQKAWVSVGQTVTVQGRTLPGGLIEARHRLHYRTSRAVRSDQEEHRTRRRPPRRPCGKTVPHRRFTRRTVPVATPPEPSVAAGPVEPCRYCWASWAQRLLSPLEEGKGPELIITVGPKRVVIPSPSSRRCAKRLRHLPAVTGWQPSAAAISVFGVPSAAASTIRQRSANA